MGWISEIISILKGGVGQIIKDYEVRMKEASERMDFETTQIYKESIERLQKHYARSIITAAKDLEADVFSWFSMGRTPSAIFFEYAAALLYKA